MSEIQFTVNGETCSVSAPPVRRLLDVLREDLAGIVNQAAARWDATTKGTQQAAK